MNTGPDTLSDVIPLPERQGGTVLEILRHASQKYLDVEFAVGEYKDFTTDETISEAEHQNRKLKKREREARNLVSAGLVLEVFSLDNQPIATGVLTEIDTPMGILVLTDSSGTEVPVQYAEVVTYPDPILLPTYILPEFRSHDDEGNPIDVEWLPDGEPQNPSYMTVVSLRVLDCPASKDWLFRP